MVSAGQSSSAAITAALPLGKSYQLCMACLLFGRSINVAHVMLACPMDDHWIGLRLSLLANGVDEPLLFRRECRHSRGGGRTDRARYHRHHPGRCGWRVVASRMGSSQPYNDQTPESSDSN